ncbi:MAG: protein kinase [Polyangiaceae bacterium]|nr:protein kinase [Polyangiaceae bacterium]
MDPREAATFDPKPRDSNAPSPAAEPTVAHPPEAELPRRFGRLVLLKHMARGGMGEVFLATAGGIEGAERPCVVKIIRREHAADRSFLARFLDEARIQSQLHHPGVAQIQEASTDPTGKPYVVIEYVEGRNLGEVRHRATQLGTRVAWPDAVAIGVALTEALAHVHERTDVAGRPLEIVHRDLSPQNVMVGYGGEVKIIDFGTARGENRRCHTVAGVVFAKPGYVAPEVANNTPGDAPADLYAVGIMLWELLAGRRFLTGEASEHLSAVAVGERRPASLAEEIDAPHELDAIIAKLTAHRLTARYASAREAMTDLVALLKRAPSAEDGARSVRSRVANLLRRLYPAEPTRSRAEFSRLVSEARRLSADSALFSTHAPRVTEDGDPALLSGTRYRLVRTLGQGAMGTVYEAEHVDLGRRVAIKALTAPGSGAAEHTARFRSEARAIAQLRHDNLVTVFDFGVAGDGRPFYVMEYLDGEPLDQRMAREPWLTWLEVVELGVQACRALEVAHAASIVHRDIKPGNLFLTRNGTLKLLDFGVAKHTLIEPATTGNGDAIEIFGTPEYMAPEQTLGNADARSDLYALGAVLYELLSGTLPHEAKSAVALFEAKRRGDPEPVSRRAPERGNPKMLDQTIQKALARSPEHRYQSAGALREALEAALDEPRIARIRRRRRGTISTAVGLFALGGLLAYGATHPESSQVLRERTTPAIAWLARWVPNQGDAAPAPEAAPPATPLSVLAAAAPAPQNAAKRLAVAGGELDEDVEAGSEAGAAPPEDPEIVEDEVAANGTTNPGPTPEAAPSPVGEDPVASEVRAAADLVANGRAIKAYDQLRRLARNHPNDARVLAELSHAAAATKSWGEAYRAAQRWVAAEPGVGSRLELARMARAVGKRDEAVATLKAVLKEQPDCPEARELLGRISPSAVAMK